MALTSSEAPYPPFDLVNRVHGLPGNDLASYIQFEENGRELKAELLRLLPDDVDLTGKRVLDFGCGAGRTMRQFLPEAERAEFEVWGVDIDEPSVKWLNAELCPPLNAQLSTVDPPLPFETGSFAFIWAVSVFTHLADTSAAWLLELHRILEPGGCLMASYMGEWNSEAIAGEPWDADRIGMNVLEHNRPWDEGGPMTFMSDWWVDEHWGRAFEIVDRNPQFHNQTWPMLRKKDVELSAEQLLELSEDPREVRALRHNVAQLQAEIERGTEREQGYANSLSWRATEPLRRLRERGR